MCKLAATLTLGFGLLVGVFPAEAGPLLSSNVRERQISQEACVSRAAKAIQKLKLPKPESGKDYAAAETQNSTVIVLCRTSSSGTVMQIINVAGTESTEAKTLFSNLKSALP